MPSNKKTHIIKVECYSGYKVDERPVSFILNGKEHMIDRIIEQWRSSDADYFKVLADDGKEYLLAHNNINDNWVLEKVF